jgi:hypothetical protein
VVNQSPKNIAPFQAISRKNDVEIPNSTLETTMPCKFEKMTTGQGKTKKEENVGFQYPVSNFNMDIARKMEVLSNLLTKTSRRLSTPGGEGSQVSRAKCYALPTVFRD